MACLGIDLGTSNSLIAVFDDDGPRLLPNALGEYLTPSVVGLADDNQTLLVGKPAKMRLVRHPSLTAARFKRLMGTPKQIRLGRRSYSAVELSAMVLKSLKADAEAALGCAVTDVVISVPAYFNALQRQATKDAAEIAGLTVQRLINEPTAAALASGVQNRDEESSFVVLDLGGGTFDVSILEMFEGVMEVRASSGDAFLGGDDFTEALARHAATKAGIDWSRLDPAGLEALLALAEDAKRRLAAGRSVTGRAAVGGREVELTISDDEFAALTEPLLERMRRPIEASFYDSGLSADQVDRVILVGGATRMAAVRSLAARVFRQLPDGRVDPDHAVALGAAVQAGLVSKHQGLRDVVMTDLAPFSLGIDTARRISGKRYSTNRFEPLIERNTLLPASRAETFVTIADNQSEFAMQIFQGESAIASENIKLGDLFVYLPRGPAGQEAVNVRFTYDPSGLLAVDATVLSTNRTFSNVIDNLASAMPAAEKAKRLKEMEALKLDVREQAENVTLLETLKHLHEVLLGNDRLLLARLLDEFDSALACQDPRVIAAERTRVSELARQIQENYVR